MFAYVVLQYLRYCSQSICKNKKPLQQTCYVCKNKVHSNGLYADGMHLGWRANNGARNQYWCMACAFPTCRACGRKSAENVMRDPAAFKDVKTREWYHDEFLNSK